MKTYPTDTPLNSAAITPNKDFVILGGGQDAMNVTQTSSRQGKFEARFYHKIFEEEIGRVRGHFGPLSVSLSLPLHFRCNVSNLSQTRLRPIPPEGATQVEARMVTFGFISSTRLTSTSLSRSRDKQRLRDRCEGRSGNGFVGGCIYRRFVGIMSGTKRKRLVELSSAREAFFCAMEIF